MKKLQPGNLTHKGVSIIIFKNPNYVRSPTGRMSQDGFLYYYKTKYSTWTWQGKSDTYDECIQRACKYIEQRIAEEDEKIKLSKLKKKPSLEEMQYDSFIESYYVNTGNVNRIGNIIINP